MLIRRTRTRDVRHRPSRNSSEGLRVCGPERQPQGRIPFRIGHVGEDAVSKDVFAWVGSIRACREPPFVMNRVPGSCGVLDVHRLFVLTSYRICPGLDHIGVFLSLVLIFLRCGARFSACPIFKWFFFATEGEKER